MNRKEYRARQERDCFNCVHKHPDGNCGSWDCEYINRREAIEAWRAMKGEAVEPKRKKGEWTEFEIIHKEEASKAIEAWQSAKCSKCGRYHTTPYLYCFTYYTYCPHCGADMRI